MKYFLFIPILAVFILAGCSKENSIMGPQSSQNQTRQWIKISHTPSLAVENNYTASKSIDGNKGGDISISQVFKNDGNWALVTAKLSIPKNAFSGTQVISYTVNTESAGIDFAPSGMSFDKTLSLDLVFTGINISGYDPSKLVFSYLDGSTIVPAKLTYANANIAQGLLVVKGGEINHFSRYGWSTIDGAPVVDGQSE
jgi:hypothetical protein